MHSCSTHQCTVHTVPDHAAVRVHTSFSRLLLPGNTPSSILRLCCLSAEKAVGKGPH